MSKKTKTIVMCHRCHKRPCGNTKGNPKFPPRIKLVPRTSIPPVCPCKCPPYTHSLALQKQNLVKLKSDLKMCGKSLDASLSPKLFKEKLQDLFRRGTLVLIDQKKIPKAILNPKSKEKTEVKKKKKYKPVGPTKSKHEGKTFSPAPPPVLNPLLTEPEWFQHVESDSGGYDEQATHVPEGVEGIMVVDSKDLKAHETINFTVYRSDTNDEIGTATGKTGHYNESYKVAAGYFTFPSNLASSVSPEKMQAYFVAKHIAKELEITSPTVEILPRLKGQIVEFPDKLFHINSPVPCLDADGALIDALVLTFRHTQNNAQKELVIHGHADASGENDYNYHLSELRAKGVKALLDSDKDLWLELTTKKHKVEGYSSIKAKVEDYQAILKSLCETTKWSCDPGGVDDKDGPKTQNGVRTFQKEYNEKVKQGKYAGAEKISVDGDIGPQTWGAFFIVIQGMVRDIHTEDLPDLNYGYGGKGLFACGESFSLTCAGVEGYTSAIARRVEVIFFDDTEELKLKEPSNPKALVTLKECPTYDTIRVELKIITATSEIKNEVKIQVCDYDQMAICNCKYTLSFEGADKEQGTTSADGLVVTIDPPSGKKGTLELFPNQEDETECIIWELEVGELPEPEKPQGASMRLNNLSLFNQEPPDSLSDDLKEAVTCFQYGCDDLELTGELDEATCKKLCEVHDESA